MNEELKTLLKDILFQLHVLSSQNAHLMAVYKNDNDVVISQTRQFGMDTLQKETMWMQGFMEERCGEEWDSGK